MACIGTLLVVTASTAFSQESSRRRGNAEYPPQMAADAVEVYKTVGDVKLNLYVFQPKDHKPSDKRPAIIFFFGGGWRSGSPKQFEKQCQYLASRGMVAISADYRVASRHRVKAVDCVADAKSSVRWVRAHADTLGVDPDRIVAAGGSAGGHLAACTGTIDGLEEVGEDSSISSRPNAMLLFNPALVLAPVNGELPVRNPDELPNRTGIEPKAISPYHHIRAGAPPTLILHGKDDSTVPYKSVEWFAEAMTKAGNRCELVGYDGASHGFFNFGRRDNRAFAETLARVDEFLISLDYLQGKPSVDEFMKTLPAN